MALVAASVFHAFLLIGLLSGVVTQQTTDFQSNKNETQFLSLLFVFGPFCFCASFIALNFYFTVAMICYYVSFTYEVTKKHRHFLGTVL